MGDTYSLFVLAQFTINVSTCSHGTEFDRTGNDNEFAVIVMAAGET